MKTNNFTRQLAAKVIVLTALSFRALAGDPIRPDKALTPGDILTNVTIEKLCEKGYVTKEKVRKVSESEKRQVFVRYFGAVPTHTGSYEIDHLVSLELGGSDSISNLWPQTYERTNKWNARVKDRLEDKLASLLRARLVSDGSTNASNFLKQIQFEIANDWIAAYAKYVGPIDVPTITASPVVTNTNISAADTGRTNQTTITNK